MTVSDRHRQRAAELLDDVHSGWCPAPSDYPAGPGKGDGTCICRLKGKAEAIAAALADAEQQAVAPVLALAEELDLRADAKSTHPMRGYDEGYRAGLSDGESYAASRIRAAVTEAIGGEA